MSNDRVVNITEFKAGSRMFESRGYSHVKVTVNGVAKALRIPIKSTGVTEVIERTRKNEPKPKTKPRTVKWDEPLGRELNVPKGQKKVVNEFDYTDPEYLAAREQYEEELALEIVDQGLDVPIKDENGNVVTDRDKKIAILKSMGMSLNQFGQIVSDVQDLTRMTDKDREDFFESILESEETPSA